MQKTEKNRIRFSHSIYDPKSIDQALATFSEVAGLRMARSGRFSEVFVDDEEDAVILPEFMNYVLFLTIQSK